jgi:PadR family transcriptional regulator PadR
MIEQNTITQMRRGVLEFCILSLIAKGDIYSAELITTLKSANLLVTEGTLYPLLSRLRKAELLDYRWEESPFGAPRKYYTLTSAGKEFLDMLNEAWNEIDLSVKLIREKKHE